MKKKQLKLFAFSILVALLLPFCYYHFFAVHYRPPATVNEGDMCIGTFNTITSSILEKGQIQNTFFPLPPWQDTANVPDRTYKDMPEEIDIEISRSYDGLIEIWLKREQSDFFINENGELDVFYAHEFKIYSPAKNVWKTVSGFVEDSGLFVDQLFVTSDGTIWGRNIGHTNLEVEVREVPLLSKYNDQNERFEFFTGVLDIPVASINPQFGDWPFVLLDEERDIFWIFDKGGAIYTYDANSEITTKEITLPGISVWKAVFGPNGTIYFLSQPGMSMTLEADYIYRYFPEERTIEPIDVSGVMWPAIYHIFFDGQERLWVGSIGWREPDGSWHKFHPRLLAYHLYLYNVTDHRWAPPAIMLESSDGVLWMRVNRISDNGLVWFDPESGESCWFTTVLSHIVEDADRNLWLVADGKLYKNSLGK